MQEGRKTWWWNEEVRESDGGVEVELQKDVSQVRVGKDGDGSE